jgi:predicted benzoate:H+ symporter BenE
MVILLNDVDRPELLAAIGRCVISEAVVIAQSAIELITRIIATLPREEVTALMEGLFQPLTEALQSEAPEVRKASVLCFVEMKVVAGTAVDEMIGRLGRTHQKLVAVYFQ